MCFPVSFLDHWCVLRVQDNVSDQQVGGTPLFGFYRIFFVDVGFLCTTPWDISAILAFMQMSGKMKRYQINLTDHAFWLGRQAFDFCLEFRDFGANVSRIHRNIPMRKILKSF